MFVFIEIIERKRNEKEKKKNSFYLIQGVTKKIYIRKK